MAVETTASINGPATVMSKRPAIQTVSLIAVWLPIIAALIVVLKAPPLRHERTKSRPDEELIAGRGFRSA